MNTETANALRAAIVKAAAEVRGTSPESFYDRVRELRWYRLEGALTAAQAVIRADGEDYSLADVIAWAGVTDRHTLLLSVYPVEVKS